MKDKLIFNYNSSEAKNMDFLKPMIFQRDAVLDMNVN